MIEDLAPYKSEDINAAFKHWRIESPNVPTPHDIVKICRARIKTRIDSGDYKKLTDFNSFEEYRAYAKEKGIWFAKSD